jgi:hypothetical protein
MPDFAPGDGSAYGEGIYSHDIYAWETFWPNDPCQMDNTRRENSAHYAPVLPPPAAWVLAPCEGAAGMNPRREGSTYGD